MQKDQNIFQRDDDDQRPEDQGQNAKHDVACQRSARLRMHDRLAKGVKRARADIAVDDADATERELPKTRSGMFLVHVRGTVGGLDGGRCNHS